MANRTFIAWSTLLLAIASWVLVGLFAWTINTDEANRALNADNAEISFVAGASALRTHALALETAGGSAQLAQFLDVDVVSAAYTIEAAGKAAGVNVKLGNAVPENAPVSSESPAVHAVGFSVEAEDAFSSVLHAARLFGTLPIPSSVTRLNLEYVPRSAGEKGAGRWHMNTYIRVLTTSDISS